jgi:hypothetical protein
MSIVIIIHFLVLSVLKTAPLPLVTVESEEAKRDPIKDEKSEESKIVRSDGASRKVMELINWLKWAGENLLHWSFFNLNAYLFVSFLIDAQN